MLRVRISTWCVCSTNASVPDPYAQGTHQSLMRKLSMFWRSALLKIGLSICVRKFAVPNEPLNSFFKFYFNPRLQSRPPAETLWCKNHDKKFYFLTRMLRPLCVCWAYESGTDAQAEHTRKALVRMLSIRVRNWCVCCHYAQHTHQFSHFATAVRYRGSYKPCWAYA